MAERKISLVLDVRADGTVSIDKVASGLGHLGDEADKAGKKTRGLEESLDRMDKGLGLVSSLAKEFAVASAAAGGLAAAVVGLGVRHNAQLEQARLAMAALVSSMGGVADFNDALTISESMVKKLQLAAIQTTAEFSDLVRVMQEGMGPAIQAGFKEDQIVKFVQMIAQMGGALGIAGDRLGQEIRAVLAGEKGPDNQIANALFGDMTDVKAKLAELKQSGELFDFLKDKMAAFAKAGEKAGDTFEGALSNLKDAITQALGEATQGATGDFTEQLKALTAEIVTFDAAGNAVFNQDFVSGVRALGDGLVYLTTSGVDLVKSLPDIALQLEAIKRAVGQHKGLLATAFLNPLAPVTAPLALEAVAADVPDARNDILVERRMKAMEDAADRQEVLSKKMQILRQELAQQTGKAPAIGLDVTEKFFDFKSGPGPEVRIKVLSEAAADGVVTLKEYDEVLKRLTPGLKPPPGGKGDGSKAADALHKQLDDYKQWIAEARAEANSAGDPLKEALAKIEADRAEAFAKIGEANKKGAPFLSLSGEATAAANAKFDDRALDELVKGWEKGLAERNKAIEEADKAAAESSKAMGAMLADIQKSVEDDRIAAIEDSVERELQTRLAANDEWYSQMYLKANEEITVEKEKTEVLKKLADEKKRRDELAQKEAEKARREDLAGTKEWAEKTRAIVKQNLGNLATDMTGVINDSTMALRGAFDELFQGIVDGQLDVAGTLKNLGKQMGNIWGQMLSNMLTRTLSTGESITSQLKGMWDALGASGGVDAAMGGAGLGSMVGGLGGMLLGPGNYAAEGGTIGGALGAAIGTYFGATQIGAIIGSVIGTAIGGAMGKGEDWVNVAIKDGVLTVTEKGLSQEGRAQLTRQLQKAIGERVKGWNSILDLFPKEMQDQLQSLVHPLDVTGGIKGGDIKDTGAFDALSDFLNDTLNRSLYIDYIMAIQKGLQGLGVSDTRISQMFHEWGQLQGEELQGAIREYIETLVESVRVRDLFKPFEPGDSGDIRGDARDALAAQKPEARIKAMVADLGALVAELPKLDPTDQIAAMQQVNQLGQQIWDNMISHLQRIDAIQRNIAQTAQSMRDQITLTGLDDQGKMDFYFQHLGDIREQMSVATDPEEVQSLYQQAMQYIQSALALDPDNKDLKDKLMGIIGDMEGVAGEQLGEARDRVMEEQLAAYELLSEAAQTLLDAVDGMSADPALPPPPPPPPIDPNDPPPGPNDPRDPFKKLNEAADESAAELDALSGAITATAEAMRDFMGGGIGSADSKPAGLEMLLAQLQGGAGSTLNFANMLGYAPAMPNAPAAPPDMLAQFQAMLAQLLAAQQAPSGASGKVTVELTGPGVDFMQQAGVQAYGMVARDLRNNPRRFAPSYDS